MYRNSIVSEEILQEIRDAAVLKGLMPSNSNTNTRSASTSRGIQSSVQARALSRGWNSQCQHTQHGHGHRGGYGYHGGHGSCKCRFRISKRDFCHGPVVLDKPGMYRLVDDIDYEASEPGTTAITITASNVVLNLCGKTLRLANGVFKTNGIRIGTETENVTILGNHGTVRDFTEIGILVDPDTTNINLLKHLNVVNCGFNDEFREFTYAVGGIVVGSEGFANNLPLAGIVKNLTIADIKVRGNNLFGLSMNSVNTVDITRSNFDETVGKLSQLEGRSLLLRAYNLYISSVSTAFGNPNQIKNIRVTDCTFNNIRSDDFEENRSRSFISGAGVFPAENVVFENCQFNGNDGVGDLRGFTSAEVNNLVMKNCQFNGNTSISRVDGFHDSAGFAGFSNGITLIDCVAQNNVTTYDQAVEAFTPPTASGFANFYGSNVSITNCVASDNVLNIRADTIQVGLARSLGFFVEGADFAPISCESFTYDNCKAYDNIIVVDSSLSPEVIFQSTGFLAAFDFNNVVFDNCKSSKHAILNENGEPRTDLDGGAKGFIAGARENLNGRNLVIRNSVFQGNQDGGILINSDYYASVDGGPTGDIDTVLIDGNTIMGNGGPGVEIIDSTHVTVSKNSILSNQGAAIVTADPTTIAIDNLTSNNSA